MNQTSPGWRKRQIARGDKTLHHPTTAQGEHMTKNEALKLALEALDIVKIHFTQNRHVNEAITAINEALAQPEQKEKFCDSNCVWTDHHPDCNLAQPPYRAVKTYHGGKPVYVAQQERESHTQIGQKRTQKGNT